jgi:hypothetical protein
MFDIENEEALRNIIDQRDEQYYVIPLYVNINNCKYALWELNQVTSFSPSIMKVGFGSSVSVFMKQSFLTEHMYDFPIVKMFHHFDYEENVNTEYVVFESGFLTDEEVEQSVMHEQIQTYVKALSERVEKHVTEYRIQLRKQIAEEMSKDVYYDFSNDDYDDDE